MQFIFATVLPFWYRLTEVVLEKRPLNDCSSRSIVHVIVVVVVVVLMPAGACGALRLV